jgi:hypothetical protein
MKPFPFQKEVTITLITTICLSLIYFLFLRKPSEAQFIPPPNVGTDKQGISPYHKREVNNTIKKHMRNVQSCYNIHLETKPQVAEGKIHFDWQIEPDGDVDKAELIASDFLAPVLEACIKKEISSWEFPPPPDQSRNTYAEFTFVFKKQENLPKAEDLAPQIINTPNGK